MQLRTRRPVARGLSVVLVTAMLLMVFQSVPTRVHAAPLDTIADRVLGQPSFTSSAANIGPASLYSPSDAAVDPTTQRLFIADSSNHRVLSWPNAATFTTGQAADLVIGQPNFVTNTANTGGLSASSLYEPEGLVVDGSGNLFVADSFNNRVLEYDAPVTTHDAADRVFGQPSFFTNTENTGGISATSLKLPAALAVDSSGNLYVADNLNNRVLEYNTPITTDTSADGVFGQLGSFVSGSPNDGGLNANSLFFPDGLAIDKNGNLYIADAANNRVLEFDAPLVDSSADHAIGQPDLMSGAANNGGPNANSLSGPAKIGVDQLLNLYVVDYFNNRVLEYTSPLNTHPAADRVFGQPDMVSTAPNNGGISAVSLQSPDGLALDNHDNIYVTDRANNRLLVYDATRYAYLPIVLK